MNLKNIVYSALMGLILAAAASAQPAPTRTFQLYTAPLGPNLEKTLDQLKAFYQVAGRQVTDVQVIQRIGFGKITGIQVTHKAINALPAEWHHEDVYVAPIGNVWSQAMQVVRFKQMASKPLVDLEVIQQIGIGKITGLRLYFAGK